MSERITPLIQEAKSRGRQYLRGLGAMVVGKTIEAAAERTPLPADYRYAHPATIRSHEVANLFRTTTMGDELTNNCLRIRAQELALYDKQAVDVGVRSTTSKLVGFASLAHYEDTGELGWFVVDPDHQGQGIGKALIDERLRIAEELGIEKLHIPNLEPTNTLRSYYLEKGFACTDEGSMVRGSFIDPIANGDISPYFAISHNDDLLNAQLPY